MTSQPSQPQPWQQPQPSYGLKLLIMIGAVLLLTIAPLVVFGFGLGVIPALLIAYYAGRKKLGLSIPYGDLREPRMNGCIATFGIPNSLPGKIVFAAAQIDGERLYREVQQHVSNTGVDIAVASRTT